MKTKRKSDARIPIRVVIAGRPSDEVARKLGIETAQAAGFSSVEYAQTKPFEGKPLLSVYLYGVKKGHKGPAVLGPISL